MTIHLHTMAFGDSAIIPPSPDHELKENTQDAIIHFKDGVETLYLLEKFDGNVK